MWILRTSVGLFLTALLPATVFAFVATDAGIVHDVGVPPAQPIGIATLSSSTTIIVGTMSTGDGVTFAAPLFVRVGPDGRVAWTRVGEGMSSLISRVTEGPDDTVLVLAGSDLIRYDANGNKLWNEPAGPSVVDMLGDATGITLLSRVGPFDGRLSRFALDGSLLWQTTLSEAAGCAPQCPPYSPVAMTVDSGLGIVVLSDQPRIFGFSTDGTLLWQTSLARVNVSNLARSIDGRIAVLGSDPSNGGLLLQVCEANGAPAWNEGIAGADPAAVDVSFDDADNVYTLGVAASAWTTHAFDSAGNSRWAHALPQGSINGGLEVGSAAQPVIVVSESPQGDSNYGIAQDGTTAFDTKLDQMAGSPRAWHRFPDGSLVILDITRGSLQTLLLGLMSPDGSDVRYATPGPTEVTTRATADGIAWQDGSEKTIVAIGSQQFVVRLDANGSVLWHADLPEGGRAIARGIGADTLIAMTVDSESGIVTTLNRRDAGGAVLWQVTEPGVFSNLAAGDDGSSFLLTYTFNAPFTWSIERRDANGALAWSTPLGLMPYLSKQGTTDPPDLMSARDGGVYVYGRYGSDGLMFVEHFDASGALLWLQSFGGLTIGDHQRGLAQDENGFVYLEYDVNADPGTGTDALLMRLAVNGDVAWLIDFDHESTSATARSLIAANGGGVLLATSAGVHRIDATGDTVWTHTDDCASGCIPNAVRQRQDGHIVALSTVGSRNEIPEGPTDIAVSELDENGNLVDRYVSGPHPRSQDIGLDLRADGVDVDVAELSMSPDGLSRVRLQRLREDGVFANGFDPAN